jgi:hypothetical protein
MVTTGNYNTEKKPTEKQTLEQKKKWTSHRTEQKHGYFIFDNARIKHEFMGSKNTNPKNKPPPPFEASLSITHREINRGTDSQTKN